MTSGDTCPACESRGMRATAEYDHFGTSTCTDCGHMLLRRTRQPVHADDYVVADDAALRKMLKATRDKEFDICIQAVKNHVPAGTWLDIGCSYGWFLERIRRGGFEPYGVEPSPTAFKSAAEAFPGRTVNGEFPSALEAVDSFPPRFDVVSAMDVLEHIPDSKSFIESAREALVPGGVLLLKVPCNEGILFKLASALSSPRRNGTLGRLWQVDFNYPHWHYYNSRSIRMFLERNGFVVVEQRRIPFSFLSTAHDRVRNYDGKPEPVPVLMAKTLAAYGLIVLSHVLRRFDNVVVVARPRASNTQ